MPALAGLLGDFFGAVWPALAAFGFAALGAALAVFFTSFIDIDCAADALAFALAFVGLAFALAFAIAGTLGVLFFEVIPGCVFEASLAFEAVLFGVGAFFCFFSEGSASEGCCTLCVESKPLATSGIFDMPFGLFVPGSLTFGGKRFVV